MMIILTEAPAVAVTLTNKYIAFCGTQIYLSYSQEPAAVLSQMTPAHVIPSYSQEPAAVLSQMTPAHVIPSFFSCTLILPSDLCPSIRFGYLVFSLFYEVLHAFLGNML
jgi:hypothetical protein